MAKQNPKGSRDEAWEWLPGSGRRVEADRLRLFSLSFSLTASVNLNMGASDIGTGTKTVMAMVVSEELGIRPEMIQIENADAGTTQYATGSGDSEGEAPRGECLQDPAPARPYRRTASGHGPLTPCMKFQ